MINISVLLIALLVCSNNLILSQKIPEPIAEIALPSNPNGLQHVRPSKKYSYAEKEHSVDGMTLSQKRRENIPNWLKTKDLLNSLIFVPPKVPYPSGVYTHSLLTLVPVFKEYFNSDWFRTLDKKGTLTQQKGLFVNSMGSECYNQHRIILVLGPNAQGLRFFWFVPRRDLENVCLVGIEYPGYGDLRDKNGWKGPSEIGALAASRAVVSWIVREKNVKLSQISILGVSIGTGVAADLAFGLQMYGSYKRTGEKPFALALLAPYTSVRAIAKNKVGKIGARLFMPMDRFRTKDIISGISCPTMYVHGRMDKMIPISQSMELMKRQTRSRMKVPIFIDDDHNFSSFGITTILMGTVRFLSELDCATMYKEVLKVSAVHRLPPFKPDGSMR